MFLSSTQAVILPVHNGETWLSDCLQSILYQKHSLKVQLSIFFDSCDDKSEENFESMRKYFLENGFSIVVSKENRSLPRGGKIASYYSSLRNLQNVIRRVILRVYVI